MQRYHAFASGIWTYLARGYRRRRGAALLTTVSMPLLATVYLAAVAAVEIIVARGGTVVGIAGDALLVLLLLNHYVWLGPKARRHIFPVLALLPLLRVLSVTMPFQDAPYMYWYLLTGLPLLLAAIVTARVLGFTPADLGLRSTPWPLQGLIALSGLPLSAAAYVLVHPQPLVPRFDAPDTAVAIAILIVCVGFTEEFLFRGLLLHAASSVFVLDGVGLVWNALAFATLYIGSLSPSYVAFMGVVGLFFAWCARRTGSLWGVVCAHSALIVGLLCVWPLVWPR